jgi:hypothetical protein
LRRKVHEGSGYHFNSNVPLFFCLVTAGSPDSFEGFLVYTENIPGTRRHAFKEYEAQYDWLRKRGG